MNNELLPLKSTEFLVGEAILNIDREERKLVEKVEELNPGHRFGEKKMKHEMEMANNIDEVAKNFDLDNEDKQLLKIIFRTHDIGRVISALIGKEKDNGQHGKWSMDWLNENKLLNNFEEKERKIIDFAVRYHSKVEVPKVDLKDETMKKAYDFCYILRDNDKIEVLQKNEFVKNSETIERIKKMYKLSDDNKITDLILNLFINRKNIDNNLIKSYGDFNLLHLSYIFDIKHKQSKDYLNKNKIEGIEDRFLFIQENNPEVFDSIKKVIEEVLN